MGEFDTQGRELFMCNTCHRKELADCFEVDRHGRRRKGCKCCKVKRDTRVARATYECSECAKEFGVKSKLSRHYRSVHLGEKRQACEKCSMTFSEKGNLIRHVRSVHDGQRSYECVKCNKTFSQKDNHDRHVRSVHDGLKTHECGSCNELFSEKSNLGQHLKVCTGERKCSGGEYACMKALEILGLEYVYDSTHDALSSYSEKYLRFDFVIIISGQSVVIEYDGQQHFKPQRFGGISLERAQAIFEKQQEYDAVKDAFCEDMDIPMLRIPYTKFESIPGLIDGFIRSVQATL